MTRRRPVPALASWSIAAYSMILHAYPASFRREFGPSMVQLFGDMVGDACRAGGLAALARLWMRTGTDVLLSLGHAYRLQGGTPMFKLVAGLGLLYTVAVAAVVGVGALRFGEFYQPPGFTIFGAPGANEDVLIATFEQAMNGEFGRYRTFTIASGFSLAILLGVASGLFGVWRRSLVLGALWLMGGGVPLAALTWAAVTAANRLGGWPEQRATGVQVR